MSPSFCTFLFVSVLERDKSFCDGLTRLFNIIHPFGKWQWFPFLEIGVLLRRVRNARPFCATQFDWASFKSCTAWSAQVYEEAFCGILRRRLGAHSYKIVAVELIANHVIHVIKQKISTVGASIWGTCKSSRSGGIIVCSVKHDARHIIEQGSKPCSTVIGAIEWRF